MVWDLLDVSDPWGQKVEQAFRSLKTETAFSAEHELSIDDLFGGATCS